MFLQICTCFLETQSTANILSLIALIVSILTLYICYKQLPKANTALLLQSEQNETKRKSKMESNKYKLILLLQSLLTSMANVEANKRGGDFKENLFTDQKTYEIRILSLIADLKARTTNSQLIDLLILTENTLSSCWNIQHYEKQTDKASAFQKYKEDLSSIIHKFKNEKI